MTNYREILRLHKYAVGSVFHKLNNQKRTGNEWGDWNCDEFTVEDSAFGFIVMENGATIVLESSWALNTLDVGEAKTSLCGDKGGADMQQGLRINSVENGRLVQTNIDLSSGSVDFFSGTNTKPEVVEQLSFLKAILAPRFAIQQF